MLKDDTLLLNCILMVKYKFQKEFMFSLKNKTEDDVAFFLSDCESLDLLAIRDQHKNTVLHHCACHNQPGIFRLYVEFFRKNLQNKGLDVSEIKACTRKFVDEPNDEGFTALHFAAYKGNVQIIEQLKKFQANQTLLTKNGFSLGHVAAQGDQVKTFLALPSLNLNAKDTKGSTALHWAAYTGSQKVVEYLLAQEQTELNPVDSELQTPLHLSSGFGNIKIVKRLLLAGSDRNLKNISGKTALDIAIENQFENIKRMLDQKWSLLDYLKFICNVKVKYRPKKRSYLLPTAFILIDIVLIFLIFACFSFNFAVLVAQSLLFLITLLLYCSLLPSPKQISKGKYQSYIYYNPISSLCMSCIRPCSPRTFHCYICKTCINQYDHHCNWINNCVGKRNLGRFVCFIFFIAIDLAWIGVLGVAAIANVIQQKAFGEFIWLQQWIVKYDNWAQITLSILLLLFPLLFFIPLLSLLVVQVKNLLLNKTTYERFSKINQSILTRPEVRNQSTSNANPGLSFSNCWNMLTDAENQETIEDWNQRRSDKSKSTRGSIVDNKKGKGMMMEE